MFRAIDEGNAGLNIPAYNGGLYAPDPSLDALQVPDEVCSHFKDLGDYDYRPAREIADADETTAVRSVIDVDILGHIFEQSITDLERLRQSLEQIAPGKPPATSQSPSPALKGTLSPAAGEMDGERRPPFTEGRATSLPLLRGEGRGEGELVPANAVKPGRRRKQEGAVYTAAFITRYLVEQALGGVLNARFDTLRLQHEAEAAGTARKTLTDHRAHASAS